MSPIEIMALIVVLLGIIKIIVIVYDPKVWLNSVVKPIYKNSCVTMVVALILAGGSLYYLLMELNLIQIFAVFFFMAALMLMSFAAYSKDTIAFATKLLSTKNLLQKAWLALLVWLVLLAWVLYVMFV